jgi:urease accessory protein
MLETLVLGRAAMGETVRHLHLRDRRQVSRNGRPVLIEAIRLDDEDLARDGVRGSTGRPRRQR